MKVLEQRLIGRVASLLKTAGIAVFLDGHRAVDSERGTSFVRVSVLAATRSQRSDRADTLLSLSCISFKLEESFSHLELADLVIDTLGTDIKLVKNVGTPPVETQVGTACLRDPNKQNLGLVVDGASKTSTESLMCVVDYSVYYTTT